mgnify:CR=1 FL=1
MVAVGRRVIAKTEMLDEAVVALTGENDAASAWGTIAGAGDVVLATLAVSLAADSDYLTAVHLANIAGGFTMTGRGGPQAFKVLPLLVRRVYADGRPDEVVRGVDIVGTPLTSFSKIIMAADDADVFNGTCGAESGWCPVSAVSPSLPAREREEARDLAVEIGVRHLWLESAELDRPGFADNPTNRCYFCKSELFGKVASHLAGRGIRNLVDGTNADDPGDHRPGGLYRRHRSPGRHGLGFMGFNGRPKWLGCAICPPAHRRYARPDGEAAADGLGPYATAVGRGCGRHLGCHPLAGHHPLCRLSGPGNLGSGPRPADRQHQTLWFQRNRG